MKTLITIQKLWQLPLFVLFVVFLSSCSINDSDTSSTEDLTEEELQIAGQIIAESLSDQRDGIFASLNDAFTLPSSNNFAQKQNTSGLYSSAVFNNANSADETSTENNYSYSYDSSTGIHLVSFSRSVNNPNMTKESTAKLEYIYYSADDSFIASPRIENDRINTIDYLGQRSGSIITPNKNSSYQRNDQFLIDGLTEGAEILTIEGLHEGSGEFKVTRENGNIIERSYELTVEFLNVEINNATIESNGNLQKGVTGALAYEMFIIQTVNGSESLKTVNGTIEFNGDGTALLRFRNILEDFRINLDQGDILDDGQFKGFVRSVDIDNNTFTLFGGQTLLLTTNSEIETNSDLLSLEEVKRTLENDIRVETRGTFGTDEAGTDIVGTVTFAYEREDVEFEDDISEVDLENRSFTLKNGTVLFMTDSTKIDTDGDLFSLQEVSVALQNGNNIEAEGEFLPGFDGTNTVIEVEFEYEGQDFEGYVKSADASTQSFVLINGAEIFTNENTKFDDDLKSIEELVTALEEGFSVEADGEYYYDSDGRMIAIEVDLEIDDDFDEHDFEGIVQSVSLSEQSFTLTNGLVLHVNSQTKFDDDLKSLEELDQAISDGYTVEADGEYYIDNGRNMVIEVDLEIKDDDDYEEYDFEGYVQSVDLTEQSFTLTNGLVLHVNSQTKFDDDLKSLEELDQAISDGYTVEADGEYYIANDGRNMVIEVDLEIED